jgi:co-chaperonin GroES (HSP10)
MRIEPLRDMVVVSLRPERTNGGPLVVVRQARAAVREAEVVAVGPECRDVTVGQVVLVNLLTATQVEESYLVAEPTVLGTL